jgi:hypothetical protein
MRQKSLLQLFVEPVDSLRLSIALKEAIFLHFLPETLE